MNNNNNNNSDDNYLNEKDLNIFYKHLVPCRIQRVADKLR